MRLKAAVFVLLAAACAHPRASGLRSFPLHGPKSLAPEPLGTLTAKVENGRMEPTESMTVKLKVDGVPVKVAFSVGSVDHPERILGYSGVTHEYDMKLLRHMHGYKYSATDGYFYDDDSDDEHHRLEPIEPAKGRDMDAFLQRNIELWVDRALTLMLLDLEQQLRRARD